VVAGRAAWDGIASGVRDIIGVRIRVRVTVRISIGLYLVRY
jgi:hypothetical protein